MISRQKFYYENVQKEFINFAIFELSNLLNPIALSLIKDFKTIIISLNIFIIVFLSSISILLIFLIINRITRLLNLIEKSSLRISISINQLKEKYFGAKGKSGSIL